MWAISLITIELISTDAVGQKQSAYTILPNGRFEGGQKRLASIEHRRFSFDWRSSIRNSPSSDVAAELLRHRTVTYYFGNRE